MTVNKVMLSGNLTKDVELRTLESGTSVAKLSIANNQYYKDKNGENQQSTSFFNVTVWGKMAEVCNTVLQKGSEVFVEGSIEQRTWEDKETKQKRSTYEIVSQNIQFIKGLKEKQPEKEAVKESPTKQVDDSTEEYI